MSPFLMNLCSCLIVLLINRGLKLTVAIWPLGLMALLTGFVPFVMIIMGLNQGMQPIAGYNYGARLYQRVTGVTLLYLLGYQVATLGFLLCQLLPEYIGRHVYFRSWTCWYSGKWSANCFPCFSDYWYPDGFYQLFFLSIGMAKSNIPFSNQTTYLPDTIPYHFCLNTLEH